MGPEHQMRSFRLYNALKRPPNRSFQQISANPYTTLLVVVFVQDVKKSLFCAAFLRHGLSPLRRHVLRNGTVLLINNQFF